MTTLEGSPEYIETYKVNPWIQTFRGLTFNLLEPREDDICIDDIAHALSNQCRFTGHTRFFYSVADHSTQVSQLVPPQFAMWGLLHDASEAYIADMSRPLKHGTPLGKIYKQVEEKVMRVVCQKFGLEWPEPPEVKVADNIMLLTEQRDLLGRQAKPWVDKATPLPYRIKPLTPEEAEHEFLDRFYALGGVN
jgi:5'-deoxynucleotidase YfbR-like HD superfamily hydrolase